MAKTRPAICWAVRIGGPVPYIWAGGGLGYFSCGLGGRANGYGKRAVRVAVVPLAEYQRLVKRDKRQGGRADEEETNQAT